MLLFAGSHRGFLKCWAISWTDESAPTCNLLGAVLGDEDHIPISAIEVHRVNDHLVVSVAKNNAIVASVIKCDGNGLQCTDLQYAVLPGLQISGIASQY